MTQSEKGRLNGRPTRRRLTEAELRAIVVGNEAGMSFRAIALRLGRPEETVKGAGRRMGLRPPRYRRATEKDVASIRMFARQGLTYRQIAERTGFSVSGISTVMGREGIAYEPSPNGRRPRQDEEEVVVRALSAARRCASFAEAARVAGISEHRLERILEDRAPLLLNWDRARPGVAMQNIAGLASRQTQALEDWGADYRELVEDYGQETVGEWIDRLSEDIVALRLVRRSLAAALKAEELR